jgi:hypothetical protein
MRLLSSFGVDGAERKVHSGKRIKTYRKLKFNFVPELQHRERKKNLSALDVV